jgi:hypothetical protein
LCFLHGFLLSFKTLIVCHSVTSPGTQIQESISPYYPLTAA